VVFALFVLNIGEDMKIMLQYLKPFYRRMSVGFGIKVTGTIVELFLPYILSHILKNVVVTQSVKQIVFWGGLMILCAGRTPAR